MPTPRQCLSGLTPFIALLAFILSGCAGPLEVKYEPRTTGQYTTATAAKVFVAPFTDSRAVAGKDPRTIGAIKSTVSDISGGELTLSEDVTRIVERAYAKELVLAGFTVVEDKGSAARAVSGDVRAFSLDIGTRDEVSIDLSVEIKDTGTGEVVWSGVTAEKGERFAGVMGNSRATISNYISASLQKAIRRSIASAGDRLAGAQTADVAPPAPATAPAATTGATNAGKAAVNTTPERAKVYFDGVYYGLSPITIELAPGVYELTVTHKGYKPFVEKVSIRDGDKTEIEAELDME